MKKEMIKGLVAGVNTMEVNMNKTVVELKEIAKGLGMKGYSKLKKAELVSAIEGEMAMSKIKEEMDKVKAGVEAGVVEDVNANISKFKSRCTELEIVLPSGISKRSLVKVSEAYNEMIKNGDVEDSMVFTAIVDHIAEECSNSYSPATRALMDSAAKIAQHAEFLVELHLDDTNKMVEAYNTIQHKPASDLSRACEITYKRISDGNNSYVINTLEDVIGISLADSLRRVNVKGKNKEDSEKKTKEKVGYLKKALGRLLEGAEHEFNINGKDADCEAIALLFKNNGLVRTTLPSDVKFMKNGEYIKVYKFLGVTPSGLRSASLIAACTQKIEMKDGQINVVNCDNRKELLDKAGSGAFAMNFLDKDNEFKKAKSIKALFKGMTRIMQCAPGSEVIDQLHTYVVLKNMAKDSTFNYNGQEQTAEMTKDGNTKGAVESLIEYIESNESDVNTRIKLTSDIKALVGTCDQTRCASSLKASTTWCTRKDLKTLFYNVGLKRVDNISFIVVGGERFDSIYDENGKLIKSAYQLVCEAGKQEELFNSLQFIGDDNAFKLPKFNNIVNLVRLKKAHLSDSATNMVVLMAMLFADAEKTMNYLQNKGTNEILNAFKQVGINAEMGEEYPLYNNFDESLIKELNNDSQDLMYLFKTAPLAVLRTNPAIVRSLMVNLIKSCQRKVNELKFDFNSKYTVVQADDAVLFTSGLAGENNKSLQVLKAGEVYCSDFTGFKKVSAVRHPISSVFAISTFKVVTLAEIMNRINKLKASQEVKQYLMNFYSNAKGYAILPADEFLMEKHDGMDWDIDAMQFILEEEAVEILAKLPNIGSQIKDEDNWQREIQLPEERAIVEDGNYNRPKNLTEAPKKEDKKETSTGAKRFLAHKELDKRDYSFNSCLKLVMEFFTSPIANVGEIANAFYNNMLLYSIMASKNKDAFTIKTQEAIARSFAEHFKCKKLEKYVPNVDLKNAIEVANKEGRFVYKSNKQICCELIHSFAESFGTVEEVRDFLLDCGFHNRYLAETSIDAAKNNYKISNMFNFTNIAKALGSNKNMVVKLYEYDRLETSYVIAERESGSFVADNNTLDKTFYSLTESMGLETIVGGKNDFKLPLLYAITDSYFPGTGKSEILVSDYIKELKEISRKNDDFSKALVQMGVVDQFAELKLYLTDIINKMIVISCKAFLCEMEKEDAIDMRRTISTSTVLSSYAKDNNIQVDAIERAINDVINSARSCYATMTLSLKSTEEFDGKASATYKKDCLLQGLKATANLSLIDFDEIHVGYVLAKLLAETKYDKTVNPALLRLFNKEICAFYNSLSSKTNFEDFSNMGVSVEKIELFIDENNRLLNNATKEELIGREVEVINGTAAIDDMFIETENKKANCIGFINRIDNHYVVQSNRDFVQGDASMGMFFNVRWAAKDTLGEMDFSSAIKVEIKNVSKNENGVQKKHYNAFVVTDANGKEYHIADIQLNANMVDTINQMINAEILTPKDFSFISVLNEYLEGGEMVSKVNHVLYLDGRISNELSNAILAEDDMEDFSDLSIPTPVDPEANIDNAQDDIEDDMEDEDFALPL